MPGNVTSTVVLRTDEGAEQLQEKREDSGQQEAHAARGAGNGARATEQRKLLEIRSRGGGRAGNFCSGQHTAKEKHGAKLQPETQAEKQKGQ